MIGVSSGLSATVLPLLASGADVPSALDLSDPYVMGQDDVDGVICDRMDALGCRPRGMACAHVQIWISQRDGLIRRVVEDYVQSDDDLARTRAENERDLFPRLDALLRDAGRSDAEIEQVFAVERQSERLSTFSTATYHPRCNEPIAPEALRATDGGL